VLLNPPPTPNIFLEPVSIRKNEGPMSRNQNTGPNFTEESNHC
jgi:hypothetical protein